MLLIDIAKEAWEACVRYYNLGNERGSFANKDQYLAEVKAKYRPVSTMTRDEWNAIKQKFLFTTAQAGDMVHTYEKPGYILVLENRVHTNTLSFHDGMELIKAGFNPFKPDEP